MDIKTAFTIDSYYDISFYNETKTALGNNGVGFVEFITTKIPYNWFIVADQYPIAINYDKISTSMIKFLITKVKPLNFNDEYKLYRKDDSKGNGIIPYIENDAFAHARRVKYACFFNIKNKQHLKLISEQYPSKIYFLGKYYNNKYKVCLAMHESIKGFINFEDILLEKGGMNRVGEFEAAFNFKVLQSKDYLVKFSETPYMEGGKYTRVKIQSDRESTSKYILN